MNKRLFLWYSPRCLVGSLLFIALSISVGWAQETSNKPVVQGVLLDSETKQPIPFANIALQGKYRGTSTNALGEFVITLDTLPTSLVVSHVSYIKQIVNIKRANQPLALTLTPKESTLEEVVVKSGKTDPRLYRIMEKVLDRARSNSKNLKYGRAFYRQKSKNDSIYSELYEMFFDTRFSTLGIEDWALQEGRYALKEGGKAGSYIFNKNFTLVNRLFPTLQPETDAYIMPMRPDWYGYYEMVWEETLSEDDKQVAIIRYQAEPGFHYRTPIMEGRLFIDLTTYDVLKLEGEIADDKLEVVSLTSKDGEWKNYTLSYEAAFTQNDSLGLLLDYIRTGQTFDYWRDNAFSKKVETEAQLTFYEYYQPRKYKRLGGRLRFDKSDIDRIERITYDRAFWENNPIVKRTPVEEEVIASFEADREFGSIFLNNQNQVSLMPELDSEPAMQQLVSQLGLHLRTQEKAYLHFDKPYYTPGETLWFKGYLFDALHHVLGYTPSKVLYVDLIDPEGEILAHRQLKIENGTTHGDFTLDPQLPSGNYLVRAYTSWMRNFDEAWFFTKEIPVYENTEVFEGSRHAPADSTLADLQFFPEGGDLIEAVPTQLAFKGISTEGLGVDVRGTIVDDFGNTITPFSSIHRGMGTVFFTPQPGKTYKAIVQLGKSSQSFPLPKALKSGFGMMVNNSKLNSISVRVVSSADLEGENVFLVGQTRGKIYYKGKGSISRRVVTFEIPRQLIPSGIFQLTLFDSQMRPQAERLVFINYAQDLDIEVKTNRKRYKARDEVEVELNVTDAEGKPVQAALSAAVTDASQISIPEQRETLLTNLLLTSDLKGNIEAPAFYFRNQEPNTLRALDALMLTQGWRRFTWKDVLDLEEIRILYPYEQGFSVKGYASYAETGKPFSFKKMYLTALGDEPGLWGIETNEQGEFVFRNLTFTDSTDIVVQGNWEVQTETALNLTIDSLSYPESHYKASPLRIPPKTKQEVLAYLKRDEERQQLERAFADKSTVILNEVSVRARPQISEVQTMKIYAEPDATLKIDNNMNIGVSNVLELLAGRIPGVRVLGAGMNLNISIRGATGPPLILVDGIPFFSPGANAWGLGSGSGGASLGPDQSLVAGGTNQGGSSGGTTPSGGTSGGGGSQGAASGLEGLMIINPNDVDRIEVLKGPSAAIFGLMGGNGVIAIYTKRGTESPENENPPALFRYAGYYQAKAFYSPQYDVPDEKHAKPDKRVTLHWAPNLLTDKEGKARFRFFNSDQAESFQIVVEGTDGVGTLGSTLHTVNAKALEK